MLREKTTSVTAALRLRLHTVAVDTRLVCSVTICIIPDRLFVLFYRPVGRKCVHIMSV